ncbi:tryptophan synthase subunit alpha [Staphylococcus pettenkoferi]|uniref:tryptophan synthase subunit alpha n=1 Tax=Staphylococcus pettenkoferi TaxID=170573 RepID=UPI00066BA1F0|nr:tryptophan synthase subunit alpha [Staphylococcus pettenkoferi]MDK7113906.1 tryptophan synthase subunit alpha [Staphylococcus pettenkoferi]MDK7282585.1 tryptophan synthase subunit alpha [Staphylococcus pettenkoferi]
MSKHFIPYIMGDQSFISNLKLLQEHGADIVEIGIPFSDPVADGPTIMEAGNKAIAEGMTVEKILQELQQHRDTLHGRYVLMTYYNIIHHYDETEFLSACEEAGVYGLIIPDLPFELIEEMKRRHPERQVKLISLIAMTASEARVKRIAEHAEGFIYTVTMNATIQRLKSYTSVPVVAGFGIRTPEHVRDIGSVADGVVIGSEIVRRFASQDRATITTYLKSIRDALDS